jgi:flagellar hook assembly protein FlgD
MAIIGYNSIGANTAASAASDPAEALIGAAYRYVAATGDTVTQVAVYGSSAGGTSVVNVAIYNWNGTTVTTKVGTDTAVTIGTTANWYTATCSTALTAGNTYVVAADYFTNASYTLRYDSPGGTTISGGSINNVLDATWSQQYTSGDVTSFYATVSPAGNLGSPTLGPFTSSASGTVVNPPPPLIAQMIVTLPPTMVTTTY